MRQSRDMDSPARSGAYAASLRDTNSVKSRTRFVLRVSPCVRSGCDTLWSEDMQHGMTLGDD